MRVISQKALRNFSRRYPNAEAPLNAWLKLVTHGHFRTYPELKATFGSVDFLSIGHREFYVFDIGGNKYRLVAAIHFNTQILFVRHLMTHAEYSTGGWKQRP